MKKNKTLRAAGILFLATMLTTCMTAGTFAKYTTGDSASDSARVAKFGVIVTADGSLFGEEYAAVGNGNKPINYTADVNTGTVQVNATGTNVVAPGTKNDTGLGYSITGTPEVDVQVTANTSNVDDVYLKAGTYAVMTSAPNITEENFVSDELWILDSDSYIHPTVYDGSATYYKIDTTATLANDYYPIKYKYEGTTYSSLNDVATAIDGIDDIYQANTDLETEIGTKTLTWEWGFSNNDAADTVLGDLAAGSTVVKLDGTSYVPVVDDTDYNLDVSLGIAITVDQID